MQYFLGFSGYSKAKAPFDPSMNGSCPVSDYQIKDLRKDQWS